MAPIDFYTMPESPPCRLVETVASILGVPLNSHPLNLFAGDHLKEDYVKLNPRHKVPFIVDGGDFKLGESCAIVTYLVNAYKPNHTLYPSDPKVRARIDEMLHFLSGSMHGAAIKVFHPKMHGTVKEFDAEDVKAFKDQLGHLDRMVANSKTGFILGTDHLSIADVSVAVEMTMCAAFSFSLAEFKALSSYLERMHKDIPKFAEINDGPVAKFKAFIDSKQ